MTTGNREGRSWPAYLFGGRLRTSTLALLLAFVAIWWLYETYVPGTEPPPQVPATEVVPPGFIPDPAYTWVPRTNVVPPTAETTPTTTPTTPTPSTTPTSPAEPGVPGSGEPTPSETPGASVPPGTDSVTTAPTAPTAAGTAIQPSTTAAPAPASASAPTPTPPSR